MRSLETEDEDEDKRRVYYSDMEKNLLKRRHGNNSPSNQGTPLLPTAPRITFSDDVDFKEKNKETSFSRSDSVDYDEADEYDPEESDKDRANSVDKGDNREIDKRRGSIPLSPS